MRTLLVAGIILLGAAPVTAQPEDRWQLTLNDGTIVWELHLVRFRDDTLVVQQRDSTLRFPIAQVDELRLVRKAERRQTARDSGRSGGVEASLRVLNPAPRCGVGTLRIRRSHPSGAIACAQGDRAKP